ncbi:MAG: acyl carrier protein [Treponema sp.]|nr:acyl carrier protein [Treponema sp.]
MTKDDVFAKLKEILVTEFDIDAADITPDATIADDLDLDSIDAVELIVKMKPYLTAKIEPEIFKSVRTVQNVVDILEPLTK